MGIAHGRQRVRNSRSGLGDYFRRMRAKLGAPKAITATAHKLARIVFHLLTTHEAYDETLFARRDEEARRRIENILRNQAKALGLQLIPAPQPPKPDASGAGVL